MSEDYFVGKVDQWSNSELMDEFSQLSDSKLFDERKEVRKAIIDRMNGETFYKYDRRA